MKSNRVTRHGKKITPKNNSVAHAVANSMKNSKKPIILTKDEAKALQRMLANPAPPTKSLIEAMKRARKFKFEG